MNHKQQTNMIYADVHAHLDLFSRDELDGILEKSRAAGVKAVITSGINVESNRDSMLLSKEHSIVKPALGLYPSESLKLSDDEIDSEIRFIRSNKESIAAIGEVGLDYHETSETAGRLRQKRIFTMQVELAAKIGKPLIVHSRKAEEDAVELLISQSANKVVMHCFMAKMKTVKRAVDAGFYFSIPCIIKTSPNFRKLAEVVPLNRLLTETDAPFLSPVKGRKSEPSMVSGTVDEIAAIKGISAEDASNIIFSNYQKLLL